MAKTASDLKSELTRVQVLPKYSRFPWLDLEPLRWRDDEGWPLLALFTLDSPRFEIGINVRYRSGWYESRRYTPTFRPRLPKRLQEYYGDVVKLLRERAKQRKKQVKLTAEFRGLIPQTTKTKITEAQELFSSVFVLAETAEWKVAESAIPRLANRDPLVVGFDGDNLWIIDHFELTPLEEYIRTEFSLPAPPT